MAASASDAHPFPIYNARYRFVLPILDADGDLVTGASSLDTELSQDCGTFADATNEATEIATSSGMYYVDLIATELDTKSTAVIVKTGTVGAKTTPVLLYPVRLPVIRTGTAQAGGASSITLDSGASAIDDYYTGCYVNITNNSPSNALGQARLITAYVGSTKVATVEGTYGTNPSSASTFEILGTDTWIYRLGDVRAFAGIAGTSASGIPEVKVASIAASAITATSIASDAITDAKVASDVTIASVTGAVGSVTGAVGSVTGNVGGNVAGSVASVTAGVTLANDAITAAKFDESTAFPLKADDAGSTQVARVGADGDTLETLSDQLDAKASQASVDDLPTNAELATSQAAADDATLAAIAALNNLSAAQVNTEVDTALADYDPPTRAELTTDTNSILSKLLKYVQLVLRKDAAIATDNATEVTALNADGGSGAGAFANTTDSQEAIRDNMGTAQTGDSFARLGAPAGASVSADLAAIEAQTDDIGVAGAGLTALGDTRLANLDATVSSRLATAGYTTPPTVGAIADQVWEEAITDHSGTVGSTAEALGAAGSAGDPWTTALPGAYGAGSAGNILGNNLNATVSSRATPAQVNTEADTAIADAALATAANLATVAGFLDTEIAAILVDTNELQTDWAYGGRLDTILDARASQTSVDDVPTNTELATALADGVNVTEINGATLTGDGQVATPWGPA